MSSNNATNELARASRLKSEFVSRMSHELRTPLNAMSGYLDLLAEESAGELNAKQKRYLNHVRTGSDHLLELVNEVLDLSKIEAGRIQLFPEWFNAGAALAEVLASSQPLAAARNIKIEHEVGRDLVIYADHLRFKQILYNLVSNALKFTYEGGHVAIAFTQTDNAVQVSVRDDGIGIPAEEQRAIFEEFHQAATAKGVKEGTGLGLSITKRLIEQQGGRIWVNSEPGRGSQFMFTVPLRQSGTGGAQA